MPPAGRTAPTDRAVYKCAILAISNMAHYLRYNDIREDRDQPCRHAGFIMIISDIVLLSCYQRK
jgi:hypothetical protein